MKHKAIVVGLLSLALIATACGRPATPAPTPVKAPPVATPSPGVVSTPTPAAPVAVAKPTGELRVAVGYMGTESLDPIMGPGSGIIFLAERVYDYLVGAGPDGKLSTDTGLAYKWEMSPDGKKWTFYLRKGVKFHNGDEVTAEDAKFSIERVMGERTQATNFLLFRNTVERMEVPDPYTLVVYTKEPAPLFHLNLSPLSAGAEGLVVPKKYIQQVGDDAFARQPIGSGPYKFKEQVFGSYVKYEALDSHWRLGVPQFKTSTLLSIPEASTRIAALKTGQADIIELEREAVDEIKKAGFRVAPNPFVYDTNLYINQQWEKGIPLADKQVRLALTLAINRPEIMKHIFMDMGEVSAVPAHAPFIIGYDPNLKPHPYDPERAKKLLAEAGYPKGFTVDMYSFTRPGAPEQPKMMEVIASYWKAIGVQPKIIPTDYAAYRALWRGQKLTGGAVAAVTAAIRAWTQPLHIRRYTKEDLLSVADRPDIHALLVKAGQVLDEKEREALMRQVSRTNYEEVVWGPNIGLLHAVFAVGNKLESFTPRPVPYSLSLDTAIRRK